MESLLLTFTPARIRVLRCLYYAALPLPLRQVAVLAQVHVYSAQRTLQLLQDEKLVRRRKQKHLVLFRLNARHPQFHALARLFATDTRMALQARAASYALVARQTLTFLSLSRALFRKVKRP